MSSNRIGTEGGGFVVVPRIATDAMALAAWEDCAKPTPAERMALELCDNKTAFLIKAKRRYEAMVSTFLQQGGEEKGQSQALGHGLNEGQGSSRIGGETDAAPLASEQADPPPKVGDMKVQNGRVWRCYEIELEGAKFMDVGPASGGMAGEA